MCAVGLSAKTSKGHTSRNAHISSGARFPTQLWVPHPHSPFWEIRVSSKWPGQALCHTIPTFIKSLTVGQNQGSQRPVWPCSVELRAEQSCRVIGTCRNGGAYLLSGIATHAIRGESSLLDRDKQRRAKQE